MHTTIELLDAARARLGGVSDYRVAKELGVHLSVVSMWRTGRRTIGNDHSLGLARLIEIDPVYVIACASAERAEAATRSEWQKVAARVHGAGRKIASLLRHAAAAAIAGGAVILGLSVHSPAQATEGPADQNVYYGKWRSRRSKPNQRSLTPISSPA